MSHKRQERHWYDGAADQATVGAAIAIAAVFVLYLGAWAWCFLYYFITGRWC